MVLDPDRELALARDHHAGERRRELGAERQVPVVEREVVELLDDLFGVVSGVTGNPGILAYASRAAPTDRPDIGYAMIFPSMTVVKILFVQIVAAVLGT